MIYVLPATWQLSNILKDGKKHLFYVAIRRNEYVLGIMLMVDHLNLLLNAR